MTKLIVFIAAASFALIAACSNASTSNSTANTTNSTNTIARNTTMSPSPTAAPDDLATGRDLYNKNCANCHKESGEGGPTVVDGRKMKPDNLIDDRRKKLSDDKYIKAMVNGIEDEGMPSFKDKMSEAEMREVVRYIRVGLQKQESPISPTANSANLSAAPANK
jgi:mono/diheme cytochrome c family protein